MKWKCLLFAALPAMVCPAYSQTDIVPDSLIQHGTLENCVRYALVHQPLVQQSLLDEDITNREIWVRLSDWLPQMNLNANAQHFYKLPTSIFQGNPVAVGSPNTSTIALSLTQTIFNRDVLAATSTARELRESSRARTASAKIDVVVNVSKAFYATLLTREQTKILNGDILRLRQSAKDAYNQYKSGIVDNTDYKRATILLNNALVQQKQAEELFKTRLAALQQQMGYPAPATLPLEFDSTSIEREAMLDTAQTFRFDNRVEFQLLKLQRELRQENLSYSRWAFLPSISAFGDYNLNYLSKTASQLFRHDYPSSLVGVQLSWPIFQGGKRIAAIQQAEFEVERSDYDIRSFENAASTEFVQALGTYKSSLTNYQVAKDNLALAREVYQTINLQYRAGVKTYLEVLTAETDLRTAELNATDAIYQLLSSKLDVQKALGTIQY